MTDSAGHDGDMTCRRCGVRPGTVRYVVANSMPCLAGAAPKVVVRDTIGCDECWAKIVPNYAEYVQAGELENWQRRLQLIRAERRLRGAVEGLQVELQWRIDDTRGVQAREAYQDVQRVLRSLLTEVSVER